MYQLAQVIACADGKTQVVLPIALFDSKEAADREAATRTRDIQKLVACKLIAQTGENSGMDTGVTLTEFLQHLGIVNVQHVVAEREVKGAVELAQVARPKLIIPR